MSNPRQGCKGAGNVAWYYRHWKFLPLSGFLLSQERLQHQVVQEGVCMKSRGSGVTSPACICSSGWGWATETIWSFTSALGRKLHSNRVAMCLLLHHCSCLSVMRSRWSCLTQGSQAGYCCCCCFDFNALYLESDPDPHQKANKSQEQECRWCINISCLGVYSISDIYARLFLVLGILLPNISI